MWREQKTIYVVNNYSIVYQFDMENKGQYLSRHFFKNYLTLLFGGGGGEIVVY